MFAKIMYTLCVILEIVFVPIFLKYYWPDRCKKSFIYKTVSSALFVFSGYFAMEIAGNHSPFADKIMLGLILGMAGDLLLHALTEKMWPFVLGVIAFLTGHLFYIDAIHKAVKTTYPDAPFFEWYHILIIAVVIVACVLYFILRKYISKDKVALMAGLSAYLVILTTMLVKAFDYVIGEIAYGTNDNMFAVAVTVGIGALLFFISDVSLGFIILVEKYKTRKMRIFNILTYYTAQILLAASIFFVKSLEIYGS